LNTAMKRVGGLALGLRTVTGLLLVFLIMTVWSSAPAKAFSLEEAFKTAEHGNPTYLRAGLALEQAELALAKLQADRAVQPAALSLRQAEGGRAAAFVAKDAARRKLRLDVRRAYYSLLTARKQQEVAAEAVGQAKEQLRVIRGRQSEGAMVKLDVLNAEKAGAEAETGQTRADNGARVAALTLADLLGMPPDGPLQLDGSPPETKRVIPEEEIAINLAGSNSFELKQATEAQAAAELAEELTDNDYTPELIKKSAASRVQDAKLAVEEVRRRLALQVRRALSDAQVAEAGLNLAGKSVIAAQEAYRAAKVRFDAGLWVADELLTAQVKLFQTKQAELQARLDLDLARAAIFSLIGD
jgi:outer membrane protein TolC